MNTQSKVWATGLMLFSFAVALLGVACSDSGSSDSDAGTDASSDASTSTQLDPQDSESIKSFLVDESYSDFICEPAPREARVGSAHGRARVCINSILRDSLQAANDTHPEGSIAIKELYSNTDELEGHAMVIKTSAGDSDDSWTWYEALAPDYSNPSYGVGLSSCAICHSGATDHIFFELP
ncbi:MAG: hypothetical protein IPJ88_09500 [Myxococcales bacterium]|nr:MAG: hypothetical protein IPJ88_09500 [Myxococcales bacterium]